MDTKTKKIIVAFKKQRARIETNAREKLKGKKDFSLWYTPGVGAAVPQAAGDFLSVIFNECGMIWSGSRRMQGVFRQ